MLSKRSPWADLTVVPYSEQLSKGFDAAYEVWCYEYLMQYLPQHPTVVEYMGGIGSVSMVLQKMLKPANHIICELHKGCYEHLKRVPELADCDIRNTDAYCEAPIPCDVAVVDNNTSTLLRLSRDMVFADFVYKVFTNSTYIIFADTACSKYHLNRQHYEEAAGEESLPDLDAYMHAFSSITRKRCGPGMSAIVTHHRASHCLFTHHLPEFQEIVRVPTYARDWLRIIN